MSENNEEQRRPWWRDVLGPGLITGASDDDPGGVATYSQAGAKFGYTLLWLMPVLWPLMSASQEIAARIGRTTGRGLAGNLRMYYSPWVSIPIVSLLLMANIFNIGADLGAMGSALKLLIGGPAPLYAAIFAAICVGGVAAFSYKRYAMILQVLTLFLFAYVLTAFVVKVPWQTVFIRTLVPTFRFEPAFLAMVVALLGTTISPYLFFWQASEEAERVRVSKPEHALKMRPKEAPAQFRRIRIDTYLGMLFSNAVAWFIMLVCAATLNANGIFDISSSDKAAEALRPLAGKWAYLLFAGGIIGTGLLAVPVLAGGAAYAVGEGLRRRVGIDYSPKRAPFFYAVLTVATLIGVAMNFTSINPMRALVWSAMINGAVSSPVMVVMMLMMRNEKVMGPLATRGRWLYGFGWLATILMSLSVIAMILTLGK